VHHRAWHFLVYRVSCGLFFRPPMSWFLLN
jgi:hypothetical protein